MFKSVFKVGLLILILLFVWAAWLEPDSIILNKKTIELSNWHTEHDNYKIAVISDLHISWPYITEKKIGKIVKIINEQNPDLVLILGDYAPADFISRFSNQKQVRNRLITSIKELKGLKKPVISIWGNHDWGYIKELISEDLEEPGIKVLEDDYISLSKNGKSFNIAGVADLWTGRPDIPGTLAKIKNNDPIILLSHNPDVFPEVPKQVELTLAGHTHGGQVNLPIIRRYWIPSHYGDRYSKGLIKEKNHYLFVTSGIGTTCLPLRLFDPPEIVILEIKKLK